MFGFFWITFCWNVWFLMHFVKLKCLLSSVLRYVVTSVLRHTEISGFSYITLCWKCPVSHTLCHGEISGFSCITWRRNICFHLYYVMLKYLFSRVLCYADISYFSCITLFLDVWFLMCYVLLKYLVSHLLCYAEISVFTCIT